MTKFIFAILLAANFAHASLNYNGDIVRNARTPFAMRHQGICHDEKFFYLIQKNKIWQVPRTTSLKAVDGKQSLHFEIPQQLKSEGANHLGDCEVDRGLLYVPVEGTHPLKILILKAADLKFISAPNLPSDQIHAPWVTVDPDDGSLLTGEFNFLSDRFAVIKLQLSSDLKNLNEVSRSPVFDAEGNAISVGHVQSAKILRSKNSLLILSDAYDGGILNFDLSSLRLRDRVPVKHIPLIEELEGLDAVEDGESPLENIPGNIVVTMASHARIFSDRFYLKSYRF